MIVKTVPLSLFTWDPKSRVLSAEASEVRDFNLRKNIIIKSHTGVEVKFTYKKTKTNKEGETEKWIYVPLEYGAPYSNIKLVVFND